MSSSCAGLIAVIETALSNGPLQPAVALNLTHRLGAECSDERQLAPQLASIARRLREQSGAADLQLSSPGTSDGQSPLADRDEYLSSVVTGGHGEQFSSVGSGEEPFCAIGSADEPSAVVDAAGPSTAVVGSSRRPRARRRRKKKAQRDRPPDAPLAQRATINLEMGVGSDGASARFAIVLPAEGGLRPIDSSNQLLDHVRNVWERVVAPHQTGLTSAREPAPSARLTAEEGWHHYQAARSGVVDSARLLIAFSVVPGLQSAAPPLHAAAARGACGRLAHLLAGGHHANGRAPDGTTALHAAAATNQPAAITVLAQTGSDLEAVGDAGVTALMIAASMGHAEAVDALLAAGAEVGREHGWSRATSLHLAAEMGHAAILTTLCRARADPEAIKSNGGTALHVAADSGMSHAICALLAPPCSARPDPLLNSDTTPLYLASQRGLTSSVRALLDGGARIDHIMPVAAYSSALMRADRDRAGAADSLVHAGFYPDRNSERANGATALHVAVENGHRATVDLLLERGARQLPSMEGIPPLLLALQHGRDRIAIRLAEMLVAAGDKLRLDESEPATGQTALFVAAGTGRVRVLARLLELNASVEVTTRLGASPLSNAAFRGHADACALLLRYAANLESGVGGGGALHAALQGEGGKASELVALLVGAGGAIDRYDGRGITPLALAARAGDVDSARVLLDAGARINLETRQTRITPLMAAALRGHTQTVRLLCSRGADVHASGGDLTFGATALHLGAQGGHAAVLKVLLAHGADPNARLAQQGATPLFTAAGLGHADSVAILLRHGASRRCGEPQQNWNGLCAIHVASLKGHARAVRALLDGGVAANLLSADRRRPLDFLFDADDDNSRPPPAKARAEVARLLVAGSADVEAREGGVPPLVAAAAAGLTETVGVLVRAGASVLARGPDETSALQAAVREGHLKVAEQLIDLGAPCDDGVLEAARARRDTELLRLIALNVDARPQQTLAANIAGLG